MLDQQVRRAVFHIIDVLLSDNVKTRFLGPDGLWYQRKSADEPVSSQDVFLQQGLEGFGLPAQPARPVKQKKGNPISRLLHRFR